MTNLLAARAQMGTSLAFHIVFAVLGMGLPVLLLIAEGLWLRTGNPVYLTLVRRWSKGFAILFAVGAVSGTILSFELGLLWPDLHALRRRHHRSARSRRRGSPSSSRPSSSGSISTAGIVSRRVAHWLTAFPIAISGTASAIFVISANAWMNSPAGFRIVDGQVVDVDPIAAMFNSAWFQQSLHMVLAAYIATGLAVAGIYAWGMLRGRNDAYHRAGLDDRHRPGRGLRAAATDQRRYQRALGGRQPAAEAGRTGGTVSNRGRRRR